MQRSAAMWWTFFFFNEHVSLESAKPKRPTHSCAFQVGLLLRAQSDSWIESSPAGKAFW